jgi:tetratricopeptide (TPR) repeat protein
VPPFRAADALAEPIVTRFTDRLPSGTSPAIREALESARAGRFDAPPVDDNAPDADRLTAVFLRGLTRLSKNQLNDAANDFRAALKISSDFFPALFYLGAAYAAGGKDKDAVGAWQTSLIGEGDAQIIYLAIADAQLRLGDHAGAKAILEEALDSWPDDAPLLTRLARTGVLLGDRRAALDRLDQALSKDPASADALFLGARIVYEAHLGGKPIVSREADIERLKRYASAYAAASGPHRDIVAQWVKYVGGGR